MPRSSPARLRLWLGMSPGARGAPEPGAAAEAELRAARRQVCTSAERRASVRCAYNVLPILLAVKETASALAPPPPPLPPLLPPLSIM